MITICGKTITVSKGDTFDIVFCLCGYELVATDKVVFTMKDKIDCPNEILEKEITGISGKFIRIQIPAEEMKALTARKYYYDLLCKSGNAVITLCYPEKVFVREVVHDAVQ